MKADVVAAGLWRLGMYLEETGSWWACPSSAGQVEHWTPDDVYALRERVYEMTNEIEELL